MMLMRDKLGNWEIAKDSPTQLDMALPFDSAFLDYINKLDKAFSKAKDVCEFEFLMTLLAVRGLQDAGWDPFETTIKVVQSLREIHSGAADSSTQRYIQLILFGHIVEASEPYEIIANLFNIVAGKRFIIQNFPNVMRRNAPPGDVGRPQFPNEKIRKLKRMAALLSLRGAADVFEEAWDRDLRNAVFHSDFCLHGSEVRIRRPSKKYSSSEINLISNRALARHDVLVHLRDFFLRNYEESKVVIAPNDFAPDLKGRRMAVLVREGDGAIGLISDYSCEEITNGAIVVRLGRFYPDEIKMLDADPTLRVLPARITV